MIFSGAGNELGINQGCEEGDDGRYHSIDGQVKANRIPADFACFTGMFVLAFLNLVLFLLLDEIFSCFATREQPYCLFAVDIKQTAHHAHEV